MRYILQRKINLSSKKIVLIFINTDKFFFFIHRVAASLQIHNEIPDSGTYMNSFPEGLQNVSCGQGKNTESQGEKFAPLHAAPDKPCFVLRPRGDSLFICTSSALSVGPFIPLQAGPHLPS